jgi:hypothetical protein
MRVVSVITLWSCDTCRCVSVRYDEPPALAVEVWQGAATLYRVPCTTPDVVAAEAERLFEMYCDTPET